MEFSVIQLAIAISIVIVCGAIAIVKIIDARAEARKITHRSFNVDLNDLNKTSRDRLNNETLCGRSIHIAREEFLKENKKSLSYQEAMLVEQLSLRLVTIGLAVLEAQTELITLSTKTPKSKIDALNGKVCDADRYFLNTIDDAAYYHLQGLISYPLFEKYFLETIKCTYSSSTQARHYTNIKEVIGKYHEELLKLCDEEDK